MSAEPTTIVPGLAGAAPMLRVLSRFNRHQLETAAEVLIALFDLQDGDADAETEALEDDFTPMPAEVDFGPGCPIADPGGQCDEDEISAFRPEDFAHHGPGCCISDPAEDCEGGGE